jgi:hypothetical protein
MHIGSSRNASLLQRVPWTWFVVLVLIGAWVVVIAALTSLAPRCAPGSPAGPTIGSVVKIAGC